MRMKRLRKGLIVYNKLNGRKYKVVSVTAGDNGSNTGIAALINAFDEIIPGETVEINEDNCLIFRALMETEPYPVPEGYSVAKGILYKDGKPVCEQGDINVKEILAVIPGKLIIAVGEHKEKNDDEDQVNVYSYEPHRDRFIRLTKKIPMPKLIGYKDNGDTAVLAYCDMTEEKRKDKDGVEKNVKVFRRAEIISIGNHLGLGGRPSAENYPIDIPMTVNETLLLSRPDGSAELLIPCDEELMLSRAPFDEDVSNCEVVAKAKRSWMLFYPSSDTGVNVPISGDKSDVHAEYSPEFGFVISDNETVFVEKGLMAIKSAAAAAVAKKYPVLIDLTKDGRTYRLSFADKSYNLKTVLSTKTDDRGFVVTVE